MSALKATISSIPYANCGVCSVASNPIPFEHRLTLLKWQQAGAGRELEMDQKDTSELLLKAFENDPSVTELDLSRCSLTDTNCKWLHKLMASNTNLQSLKCVMQWAPIRVKRIAF